MSNTICDSGVGRVRIISTDKPKQGQFIPCANLATAQLYASDPTRVGKDAFDAALVDEYPGNAAFYVVERIAPGISVASDSAQVGASEGRSRPTDTLDISGKIDNLIDRIADALMN